MENFKKYESLGRQFYPIISEIRGKFQSLMSEAEMSFLMSIIYENKIENVLEIGVWQGVSSLCMIKSGLKANKNFNLYSIDINSNKDFCGIAVEKIGNKEEKNAHHLFLGKTSFDIEELIPKNTKFDLVFIDGAHWHPYPTLDLLFSIPYLKDNSIVILHDIVDYYQPYGWGGSFIFESWNNEKYRAFDNDNNYFTAIGAIKLHKNTEDLLENIKQILKIPFRTNPWAVNDYKKNKLGLNLDIGDFNKLKEYMYKYYPKEITDDIFQILNDNLNKYIENHLLYIHETRMLNYLFNTTRNNFNSILDIYNKIDNTNIIYNELNDIYNAINNTNKRMNDIENSINYKLNMLINKLAWWIPIKKWRDNFRYKLTRPDQTRPDQTRPDQTRPDQTRPE